MEEAKLFKLKEAIQEAAIIAGAAEEELANDKKYMDGEVFDGIKRQLQTLDGIVTSYIALKRMNNTKE